MYNDDDIPSLNITNLEAEISERKLTFTPFKGNKFLEGDYLPVEKGDLIAKIVKQIMRDYIIKNMRIALNEKDISEVVRSPLYDYGLILDDVSMELNPQETFFSTDGYTNRGVFNYQNNIIKLSVKDATNNYLPIEVAFGGL